MLRLVFEQRHASAIPGQATAIHEPSASQPFRSSLSAGMNALRSARRIRVFVHLARGFGAQRWEQRLRSGEVVGLNEHLPYGYFWAEEEGCAVTYSEDKNETLPERLVRMGMRWILGFDLIHAWCNRTRRSGSVSFLSSE